jgi:uncharacterized membrane protein (UPF0127 family)
MKEISILNLTKNTIISKKVKVANGFLSRLKGLMFKKEIGENEGILLTETNSIHTFFMFFPIDVLFLDENFSVVKKLENLKPNLLVFPFKKAKFVVELKAGKIKETNTEIGDKLIFEGELN